MYFYPITVKLTYLFQRDFSPEKCQRSLPLHNKSLSQAMPQYLNIYNFKINNLSLTFIS